MLYEGTFSPPVGRFAIVAARFNSIVVEPLLAGCLETFARHGVLPEAIDVVRVPGAFEIPLLVKRLGSHANYAAIVTLGCVIRGDTDHYDHVAGTATSQIGSASVDLDLPVIYGVLTCENLEQAMQRAGGKAGNKGSEAAITAIEMVNLLTRLAQKGA